MFSWNIRPATEDEIENVTFRKEHEGAGNRRQTDEARRRAARVGKIKELLEACPVVAVEINGADALAEAYGEQAKIVDFAMRRHGLTLRTKMGRGATGVTMYIKREASLR